MKEGEYVISVYLQFNFNLQPVNHWEIYCVKIFLVVISLTIKSRLFKSNILMILLPLVMTAIAFSVMRITFMDHTGRGSSRHEDISIIGMSMAGEITAQYDHVANNISMYRSSTGSYFIVLPDSYLQQVERSMSMFVVLTVLSLFGAVFWVNWMLTRRITNRIVGSINTLVHGVNEITGGNLTYRIKYNQGDEFDAVCADFNEMASRLLSMVQQRQADENNRKELIAGISHDLRTPLTSIKAYIEGIKKGVATTPEMQEKYLDIIQNKTEDIEYIISQLFTFSKMDIGEFPFTLERVNIGNELSKMVTDIADEYLEKGLKVSLESTLDARVSIDVVQFRNVIQNILGNSVKYCKRDDAHAQIFCKKTNDSVIITVRDNGGGVSDEMLTQIFEIFYRGDMSRHNPSQGSGLGLAISAKVIDKMKGTITAENAADGGLSIAIALPIIKGEQHEKNTDC